MTIDKLVTILNELVAFMLSAAALLWAMATFVPRLKKMRQDIKTSAEQADADVSHKYKGLLLDALARIDDLDERFTALKMENEQLKEALRDRDQIINEWSKGIERLIKQLVELGQTPVWQPNGKRDRD